MSAWTDRQYEDERLRDQLTQSIVKAYKVPNAPLTAHDRCDACGAAAAVRVHRPPTTEHPTRKGVLEFCLHHYRKHTPELYADGWTVATKEKVSA